MLLPVIHMTLHAAGLVHQVRSLSDIIRLLAFSL